MWLPGSDADDDHAREGVQHVDASAQDAAAPSEFEHDVDGLESTDVLEDDGLVRA